MSHKASRSGLFLLELIMSILFFSIAGAICVRLFVNSHILSQRSVELNHALEWSQNVAELFYGCNGNPSQMADGISRIYAPDAEHSLITDLQPEAATPYPASFQLTYDEDYLLRVCLLENDGLIFCNISAQKLSLAADNSADTIYQLNLTLFPSKEAVDGN